MAYTKTTWTDRQVSKPLTYTFTNNGDGTTTLIPAEGSVINAGTPITASNLNKIETGIADLDTGKLDKFNGTATGAITINAPTGEADLNLNGNDASGTNSRQLRIWARPFASDPTKLEAGLYDTARNVTWLRYNASTLTTTVDTSTFNVMGNIQESGTNLSAKYFAKTGGDITGTTDINIPSGASGVPLRLKDITSDSMVRFISTTQANYIQSANYNFTTAKKLYITGHNGVILPEFEVVATTSKFYGIMTQNGSSITQRGANTGITSNAILKWEDSAGTRQGWIGRGTTATYDVQLFADFGDIVLSTATGKVKVTDALDVADTLTMTGSNAIVLNGGSINSSIASTSFTHNIYKKGGQKSWTLQHSAGGDLYWYPSATVDGLDWDSSKVFQFKTNGDAIFNGAVTLGKANAGLEIGASATANTPYIDFHSGATGVDYDSRIKASGGNGSNGGGSLEVTAFQTNFTGTISEGGNPLSTKYAQKLDAGTLLWTGDSILVGSTVITPTKNLFDCQNGWLLIWGSESGQEVNSHTPVWKHGFQANPQTVHISGATVGDGSAVTKIFNIAVDGSTITGNDNNNTATNTKRHLKAIKSF